MKRLLFIAILLIACVANAQVNLISGVSTVGGGVKVYSNTSVPGGNTVANTTTETAASSSYTIPANSLSAGDVIRVKLWGVYSTAIATTPTMTMRLKLGGTTYISSGAVTTVGGVSNTGWSAEADLSFFTIGASGTVDAQGYGELATAATTSLSVNAPATNTQTIDNTVDEALTITFQWGTANAGNIIVLRQMTVLLCRAQGNSIPLPATQGGTNQTTYTQGDLLYASAANTLSKLAKGTTGQLLSMNSTVPVWRSPNTYQATPSNPAAITSTTDKMAGLAGSFTPSGSGAIIIIISGDALGASAAAILKVQIHYGTGSAPANGDATTGTAVGGQPRFEVSTNGQQKAWSLNAIVTGLTPSTAYWLDVAVQSSTGAITLEAVSISVYEL